MWGDGAPSDVLLQDTDTREEVVSESVYVCGEYRELCCRNIVGVGNIVGVDEGSVIDSGSGDVSKAGDKGGNREVTSKPLSFVNAPPEGCVWEQWGDLGVAEGMWEVEAGVSEIEVYTKGRSEG